MSTQPSRTLRLFIIGSMLLGCSSAQAQGWSKLLKSVMSRDSDEKVEQAASQNVATAPQEIASAHSVPPLQEQEKDGVQILAELVAEWNVDEQRKWLNEYTNERFNPDVRDAFTSLEWSEREDEIRLLHRRLDLGYSLTATDLEQLIHAVDDTVARAITRSIHRYQMGLYEAYRQDRLEYDRRAAQWTYVNHIWEDVGRSPSRQNQLLGWIALARAQVGASDLGELPEQPFTGRDDTDPAFLALQETATSISKEAEVSVESQPAEAPEPSNVPLLTEDRPQSSGESAVSRDTASRPDGESWFRSVWEPTGIGSDPSQQAVGNSDPESFTEIGQSDELFSDTKDSFGNELTTSEPAAAENSSGLLQEWQNADGFFAEPKTSDASNTETTPPETDGAGKAGLWETELAEDGTESQHVTSSPPRGKTGASQDKGDAANTISAELQAAIWDAQQDTDAESVSIDTQELAARLGGFRRAVDEMRDRLSSSKSLDLAELTEITKELGELAWRRGDLALYYSLVSSPERARLPNLEPLAPLLDLAVQRIEELRSSAPNGSDERQEADLLLQRVEALRIDAT